MKGGVRMEDTEIVALYWARDQRAITESGDKYGTYCASIARNILGSPEDALRPSMLARLYGISENSKLI